jgi:hypothetical protein
VTEIIPWIDPSRLLPRTRILLDELGPFLVRGLTLKEIGRALGKSEDWASSRVRMLREDLARHVLAEAGEELPAELRERLERYLG